MALDEHVASRVIRAAGIFEWKTIGVVHDWGTGRFPGQVTREKQAGRDATVIVVLLSINAKFMGRISNSK